MIESMRLSKSALGAAFSGALGSLSTLTGFAPGPVRRSSAGCEVVCGGASAADGGRRDFRLKSLDKNGMVESSSRKRVYRSAH